MKEYVVGKVGDIPDKKGIAVNAGGRVIAVFRVNGSYYALHNTCPHKGASLCDGEVRIDPQSAAVVRCPWHNWAWELETGKLDLDHRQEIRKYEVFVDGEEVVLRV